MHSTYPKHIAIILDGNRRWARQHNLPPWKGHHKGLQVVRQLFDWAKELHIKELTLYSFSTENFHREKKEVDYLMRLLLTELRRLERDPSLTRDQIKVKIVGDASLFPKNVQEAIKNITKKTADHGKLTLNLALGYGGRQEIVNAVKQISAKVRKGKVMPKEVNEECITQHLYLKNEPDIIIRPGGERRVSNFLIWQGYYSEWFFLPKMWPEFTKVDLKNIIANYTKRKRRYGA